MGEEEIKKERRNNTFPFFWDSEERLCLTGVGINISHQASLNEWYRNRTCGEEKVWTSLGASFHSTTVTGIQRKTVAQCYRKEGHSFNRVLLAKIQRDRHTHKKKSLSFLCVIAHLSSSGKMVHWEKWKSVFPDSCLIKFPFPCLSFTVYQKTFLDCISLWIKLFTHVLIGVHFLYVKAMQNLFTIHW